MERVLVSVDRLVAALVNEGCPPPSGLPAIDRYLSNYVEGMAAFGTEAKYREMFV
jgi:hypothetical protein